MGEATRAVLFLFALSWGVPWLVDSLRRPSNVVAGLRRLMVSRVEDSPAPVAMRLHAWALCGALVVMVAFAVVGEVAVNLGTRPLGIAAIALVTLVVLKLGNVRLFGLRLGLLRDSDEFAMWKLSSILSGNGPLTNRMLGAYAFGSLLEYLGTACLIAAALKAGTGSTVLPALVPGVSPSQHSESTLWVWVGVYTAVGFAIAGAGRFLRRFMLLIRRRSAFDPEDARRSSGFVLLLRSFADDDTRIVARRNGQEASSLLRCFVPRRRLLLEDVIGWSVRRVGPILAVADPRTATSPSASAERVTLGDEWRAVVTESINRASVVVVVVGATPGVRWELEQIARAEALPRTLFVLPPSSQGVLDTRLGSLRASLAVDVPEHDGGPQPLVAVVDRGTMRMLRTGATEEIDYRAAIDRGLQILGLPGADLVEKQSSGAL